MTNTVSPTEQTRQLLRDAAGSTRHDDMDASSRTIIASYAAMMREAEALLRHEVASARSLGVTWQEIGDAFQITRQAAQQRFGA